MTLTNLSITLLFALSLLFLSLTLLQKKHIKSILETNRKIRTKYDNLNQSLEDLQYQYNIQEDYKTKYFSQQFASPAPTILQNNAGESISFSLQQNSFILSGLYSSTLIPVNKMDEAIKAIEGAKL